jgi:hypothetical protein
MIPYTNDEKLAYEIEKAVQKYYPQYYLYQRDPFEKLVGCDEFQVKFIFKLKKEGTGE